jgi:hypothetical protein
LVFFLPLISIFRPIVILHQIVRSLIEFVDWAEIIGLDFLVDGVISGTVDGGFDRAGLKLVEIQILLTLRHHLEYIKMLFLTELYKIPKLLCPLLLCISCPMVHSRPNYETLLFGKTIKVFIYVHGVCTFTLTHLCKLVGRSRFHFTGNLFLGELLGFDLLFGHGLSNALYLVEAIVFWLDQILFKRFIESFGFLPLLL